MLQGTPTNMESYYSSLINATIYRFWKQHKAILGTDDFKEFMHPHNKENALARLKIALMDD